jgi:hypothetical protein
MQEPLIKEKIKERFGKIALTGNETCCAPSIEFKSSKSLVVVVVLLLTLLQLWVMKVKN